MIDYNDAQEFEDKILNFCKCHNKIYLYGAGLYGRLFFEYLKSKKVNVESFLTTYDEGELLGCRVKKYSDMVDLFNNGCGIILSVNGDLQRDIMKNNVFPCDVFQPDPLAFIYIDTKNFIKKEYFDVSMCRAVEEYKGEDLHRILIIQVEVTFGDMIWSSAFVRELKNAYPNSHITMVINPLYKTIYESCPYIDELMHYNSENLNDFISPDIVKKSKNYAEEYLIKKFDAVFLPRLLPLTSSDAWENVLLAVYSDAKYRFGHAFYITEEDRFRYKLIRNLFSDIAKHCEAYHEAYNDLELISLLGHNPLKKEMELWINDNNNDYAKNIVDDSKYTIVVGVVGSKNNRSWDPRKYGNVFNRLLEHSNTDVQILLLGGKDAVIAADIIQETTMNRCVNLTGKTLLMQSAAIITKACLYVGSDTGLMHMASASGVPVIEISASNKTSPKYWGSSPTRTGPWQVQYVVLQPEKGLDDCKYMCHKSYSHCINQICEDDVYNAINKIRRKI